jgi:hypothetical protein
MALEMRPRTTAGQRFGGLEANFSERVGGPIRERGFALWVGARSAP